VVCLLLASLTGCTTHYFRGRLEKRIAARLRTLIGPANHYSVRIEETRDAELVLGNFRRVTVEGQDVLVGGVIRLERLRMEAHGLRFRGGPDRLERVDWSHLMVELSEAALNDYLARVRKEEAHVTLAEGEVTLRGVLRLLGTPVDIETRGTVVIAEGRTVLFRAREVRAPAVQLSDGGVAFVERQVNPLVDVSRVEWPVRLDAIQVHVGKIILEGSLDLPRE
jgi:hypothetical protein